MALESIRIHPADTVVVALEALAKHACITVDGASVTLQDGVPKGHKIAVRSIQRGENIVKYGHVIGHACVLVPDTIVPVKVALSPTQRIPFEGLIAQLTVGF